MIEVTVDSPAVDAMIEKLTKRLANLQPAMESIGQELESRISGRFETRTDPAGKAWAPWAESTRESYPKDGRGKILERYGDMLHSLNHQADRASVRIGFGATAGRARDVYAVYHELSTETMPRRGMLFEKPETGKLSSGDEAAVLDVLEGILEDATK